MTAHDFLSSVIWTNIFYFHLIFFSLFYFTKIQVHNIPSRFMLYCEPCRIDESWKMIYLIDSYSLERNEFCINLESRPRVLFSNWRKVANWLARGVRLWCAHLPPLCPWLCRLDESLIISPNYDWKQSPRALKNFKDPGRLWRHFH